MARYIVSWNVICTHRQQLGRPDEYIGTIHSSAVVTSGQDAILDVSGTADMTAKLNDLKEKVLAGIAPQHQRSQEYHIFQVLAFVKLD